jgi:GPH family glycoside/pentoside/hexuronide:cation symporter
MTEPKKIVHERYQVSPEDRVPLRMKIGYGIGDFGANLVFLATLFYILYYFTDVFGIPPEVAGIIVLASKSWDAISDPIMGTISDRTTSRWGKKRPYLLFGAVPLGITVFLLFYSPDFSNLGTSVLTYRVAWALLTYILFCTAITIVNVPYAALTATMTRDSHERSVITGFRMTFGIIGTLVAAGATLPLVGVFGAGDQIIGFRTVGVIYGILIALASLVTFVATRERVGALGDEGRKTPIKETIAGVVGNRPFILLVSATLMFMIGMNTMAAVVTYYFKYNLNAENLVAVANLCIFIPALLSLPLFVFIGKKLSKKLAYNLGMGIVGLMLLLIFFFGEKNLYMTFAFLVVAGIGLCTNWLSPWAIIPDTVEYSEWKLGIRQEGTLYGIFYFVFKFGAAVAGFLAGQVLNLTGYVANQPQTETALLGIRSLLTVLPLLFIVLGIVTLFFFPIDARMHRRMVEEIRVKKQ